jgi:4-aminobutyrate aminotransferase-like enzyme
MTEPTKEAVRALLERHGYKLRKRGDEYQWVDAVLGEVRGGGTLAGIAWTFDLIEKEKLARRRGYRLDDLGKTQLQMNGYAHCIGGGMICTSGIFN